MNLSESTSLHSLKCHNACTLLQISAANMVWWSATLLLCISRCHFCSPSVMSMSKKAVCGCLNPVRVAPSPSKRQLDQQKTCKATKPPSNNAETSHEISGSDSFCNDSDMSDALGHSFQGTRVTMSRKISSWHLKTCKLKPAMQCNSTAQT